nr:helix-turn-helix transcriptional regulator [Micromonospora sp. DSM 115978]
MNDQRLEFLLDELRFIRAARGVTQEELAKRINWSASTVAMVETGARKPPVGFWDLVDTALDTGGTLTRLADRLGTPQFTVDWATAEGAAVALRSYESTVFPGLLQTETYARAVLRDAGLFNDEEVQRHLGVRMARQEILTRERPPQLVAVLDEGVLRRPVGGPRVMREQILAIVKACEEKPHVWAHVVPASVGAYVGLNGPFMVAVAPDGQTTGYLDNHLYGDVVDGAEQVARLQISWEAIRGEALPQRQSIDLMNEVAQTWS